MRHTSLVFVLLLAGCSAAPCPDGQARDNAGTCVVIAPPATPIAPVAAAPSKANYFDKYDNVQPDPVVDQNAVAEYNQQQRDLTEARRQKMLDDIAADARTDRIVEAQQETQRAVERVEDKLD